MKWTAGLVVVVTLCATGCRPDAAAPAAASTAPAASRPAPAPQRDAKPLAAPRKLGGAEQLARHPWWRPAVSTADVNTLLDHLIALDNTQLLTIQHDGSANINYAEWGVDFSRGTMAGGADNVAIVFGSWRAFHRRRLTRAEAEAALAGMLDTAHASEESYRRTGKGQTNLDLLNQIEAPRDP